MPDYIFTMNVINLIVQVYEFDLERDGMFDHSSNEAISQEFNGIGPEWLPEKARKVLTSHLWYFAPAALIHDWDFACYPHRDKQGFWVVNERLRRNCRKLLEKGFPWYKRILYRNLPDIIADACHKHGWEAWQEAQK